MFKRNRSSHKQANIRTLIDAKTRIDGHVTFAGGLHLDGTINGNVAAADGASAFLSVSETGCVEGTVVVPTIVLNGQVKGDILASEHIKLGPRARVLGNVSYVHIETSVGAQINGKLIHRAAGGDAAPQGEVAAALAGEVPL
jgi:cytoskeletal protein CcmA (bactofilin family)